MKAKLLFLLCLIALTANAQKRVSVLGDSYSTYQGYITPATNEMWYFEPWIDSRTDVSDVKQTWWWQLCNDNGFKLEQNNSYSGATISYTGYGGEDYSARSFITRAANVGSPDILLVFGATNDSWANSPLGEMKWEKWEKKDLYSYRPAVCYLGQYLFNRYPNTEVYFLLNNELKPEIGEAMEEVCQRFGFTIIKLQDISKQNGHPDIKGMKQIAEQVGAAIKDKGHFPMPQGPHKCMKEQIPPHGCPNGMGEGHECKKEQMPPHGCPNGMGEGHECKKEQMPPHGCPNGMGEGHGCMKEQMLPHGCPNGMGEGHECKKGQDGCGQCKEGQKDCEKCKKDKKTCEKCKEGKKPCKKCKEKKEGK